MVTRDKGYYMLMKKLIHQEGTKIINIHMSDNRDLKYMKQKLMKLKRKIEISMIVFEDFSTPLSTMDRTARHEIISRGPE